MTPRIRIGILYGGNSAEHEISILSARHILSTLDRERFEPVLVGITRQGQWLLQKEACLLEGSNAAHARLGPGSPHAGLAPTAGKQEAPGLDVVFPVLHGPQGEDGCVQGMLELAGIPYVGAGVLGSAVGMDKDVAKRLLMQAGIPVPAYCAVRRTQWQAAPEEILQQVAALGYPVFTKPANLGSSVGVSRVAAPEHLAAALEQAFAHDNKALVEAAVVDAREIEVAVLGNHPPRASVPGEIRVNSADGFYSYDAKYLDERGAELVIPAPLDAATTAVVQELAVRTFVALECRDLARVDFFMKADGSVLVNEINTLPGFTAISMYPQLWAASGMSGPELTTALIELARARVPR